MTSVDGACRSPASRTGDRGIAIVCIPDDQPQHITFVLPLGPDGKAGPSIPVTRTAGRSVPVAGGHPKLIGNLLIWVTYDGELAAARFDPATGLVGTTTVVQRQLRRSPIWSSGHYDITAAGDLVYVTGSNAGVGRFIVAGKNQSGARPLPIEPRQYLKFAPSPDGKRIAATAVGVGDTVDLWSFDVGSGQGEKIATASTIGPPAWRPDGRLVFELTQEGSRQLVVADPDRGNATQALEGLPFTPQGFVGGDTAVGEISGDIAVARLDSNVSAHQTGENRCA